jgi:hypothetical protein
MNSQNIPDTSDQSSEALENALGAGSKQVIADYSSSPTAIDAIVRSVSSGAEQISNVGKVDQEPVQEFSETDWSKLEESCKKAENCKKASGQWSVIQNALRENPIMMRNLKRLQDAGAELVVTEFNVEEKYIEFADAALNLDIKRQQTAFELLTQQERDDAIDNILQPLAENPEEKVKAKDWITSQLYRSGDGKGLNWAEALVFAVAHGGTLISIDAYNTMARRDPDAYENLTWTWYFEQLSVVMKNGGAPLGARRRGVALRGEGGAYGRVGGLGARVAGLRVQLSA